MRTPQTAAEMIINNDLDSTLVPSFTRVFFFSFSLHEGFRDTKATLSPHRL